MDPMIQTLLASSEPAIRYKAHVGVLGEASDSAAIRKLRREIRASDRVQALLSERDADGTIPYHPYSKWYGAHWVLPILADMGYPSGDKTLIPLREQILRWLLDDRHIQAVRVIAGRARRCGSQEGNALWGLLMLGLEDERCDRLAQNLMRWQWPDGGWNCDDNPEADNSSFHETLLPLRALSLYSARTGNTEAADAAKRAAEVFLKRRLFRKLRDGSVMQPRFLRLRYPGYWQYDVLAGLRVMAEAGFLNDERCQEALDLLEAKRLPDGGFAAEERLYQTSDRRSRTGRWASRRSLADFGVAGRTRSNEFVTADALTVLRAAGRLTD
jgi:hypothetical protein